MTNRLFVRLLTVTGTVEPTTVAGLASQAEGPVLGCRVREGDHVSEGQELLRIGRQLSAEAAQPSAKEELRLAFAFEEGGTASDGGRGDRRIALQRLRRPPACARALHVDGTERSRVNRE